MALVHEITGAVHPEAARFVDSMAKPHRNKLLASDIGVSWTANSFKSIFYQRLSSAVSMAVAAQINLVVARRTPRGDARKAGRGATPGARACRA